MIRIKLKSKDITPRWIIFRNVGSGQRSNPDAITPSFRAGDRISRTRHIEHQRNQMESCEVGMIDWRCHKLCWTAFNKLLKMFEGVIHTQSFPRRRCPHLCARLHRPAKLKLPGFDVSSNLFGKGDIPDMKNYTVIH